MDNWKPLPACDDYMVCEDGRIASRLKRGRKGGSPYREWHLIKPHADKLGYMHFNVALGRVTDRLTYQVHRAVLEAFVGICPPGMQCRHLDGDPGNNRLGNLLWGTPLENTEDKAAHGRIPAGEEHWATKLTEPDVREMRRLRAEGMTYPALAAKYGMTEVGCYLIVARKRWKHVA